MDPSSRLRVLCEQGNSVEVDVNIPIRRYYRSGMEMAKMAKIYEEERNYENAFVLYMRYITLFVEKIRAHQEFRNHASADKALTTKRLKEIIDAAEKLKVILKEKYQKEYKEFICQQKMIEEKLVKEREEKRRLDNERGAKTLNTLTENHHHHDKWDNVLITPNNMHIQEDPSVKGVIYPTDSLTCYTPGTAVSGESDLTNRPSPDDLPYIPSRDLKPALPHSTFSLPDVNRETKPVSLLSGHHDSKSVGLRTVAVPNDLMKRFLALADANTTKNIETCGILAGKLANNKFLITHLLVPQQVGTPDSCTTQHEEELFEQQDHYDLITLGWIHTHPTQTAFLSSVDLHTHCSYQLMMPEAIAIVCAPKFSETGFFTLTQNHGLSFIANCRADGFHPHPLEPPLFQTASHFMLDSTLSVQIVDLRR